MSLDVSSLGAAMCSAAMPVLRGAVSNVESYLSCECTKLAQTLAMIEAEHASGEIDEDEAQVLLDMQKTAMRTVLTSIEGLGAIAAQNAINAAIAAVRSIVNGALKFALL